MDVRPDVLPRLSIKGLSDTMSPFELVPSLLVFGSLPTFSMDNRLTPDRQERVKMVSTSRKQLLDIRAEQ